MRYVFFLLLFCTAQLISKGVNPLRDWKKGEYVILNPTKRKPARTAVLIIAPPRLGDAYVECRWKVGKKVWEQYMNAVPNVDCYFLQSTYPREGCLEQVWIEGNTIYVGDWWYEKHGEDRILHKTILAIEKLLPNYTHFIRTNLNTFINLKTVNEYMETHHQSMYTAFLWENQWYTIGFGILFTADVAAHIVDEYRRLEGLDIVNCYQADDALLTSLATGIYPRNHFEHVFHCCSMLPLGVRQLIWIDSLFTMRSSQYGMRLLPPISLRKAIEYCKKASATTMLYRIREGFDLDELAELYEYLLHKIYPELSCANLVEYAVSLPTTREPRR